MTEEPVGMRPREPGDDRARDAAYDRPTGLPSDLFQVFAENSADTIVRSDSKGILLYVSPACRAWGYEPEELIGRSGAELVHPDDLPRFSANVAEVFAGGPIDRGADRTIRYRQKDGNWVWLEGNPQAVRDTSGRVVELLNVLRDVSERRSCPIAWCNCGVVITAISGGAGIVQLAGIDRLTRGSSLKGARVSRVM